MNRKALIITGGCIEDEFTLDYLKKENYDVTFAVDRGLGFFHRTGLTPDYIVGDFDSIEDGVLENYMKVSSGDRKFECQGDSLETVITGYEENSSDVRIPKVIRLNPMKDDTDTEHALHMALDMGYDSIHIFGATGTRLDHVLGNLQLLGYALRYQAECIIIDTHNRIRLIDKETVLEKDKQFGKYVSLIPYTPQVTGLTLEGFLYPLQNHTMSSFYMENAAPISGISNEIVENVAKISLDSGILVLVEARDE